MKKSVDNLNLAFLRGGDSEVGYRTGLHTFWFAFNRQNMECKFYLPTEGRGEVFIDGKHYPLQKGKWFLIGAGEKRSYYTVGENYLKNQVVHFCTDEGNLKEDFDLPDFIELDDDEYECAKKLMEKVKVSDRISPVELSELLDNKHKVYEIFSYYLELVEKKGLHYNRQRSSADDMRLMLFEYIDKCGFNQVNIGDLANKIGINASHFSVYFNKLFYLAPNEMIYKRRFDAAVWDLSYSSDSVKKIAQNCGFKSIAHFCTMFKKYMGITPVEYRKDRIAIKKEDSPQEFDDILF